MATLSMLDHVSRLVFLLSCPSNISINHPNFYCIKQIDYIFPCMCTVTVMPLACCDAICDLLQYTRNVMCNKSMFNILHVCVERCMCNCTPLTDSKKSIHMSLFFIILNAIFVIFSDIYTFQIILNVHMVQSGELFGN